MTESDRAAVAAKLRRDMRQRRRELPATLVTLNSSRICLRASRLPEMRRAKRIGIYLAVEGEADCSALIAQAWLRKIRIFAPVVAQNRVFFVPIEPDTKLVRNQFGIAEPKHPSRRMARPESLDVVFVPLTVFDSACNRLGMGAGFYDRSFSFRRTRRRRWKPRLIGLAYSFQRVPQLPAKPWDVPLDCVITEEYCIRRQ